MNPGLELANSFGVQATLPEFRPPYRSSGHRSTEFRSPFDRVQATVRPSSVKGIEQFVGGGGGGADFADNDSGGVVSEGRGFNHGGAGCARGCEGRDYGITSARHVIDFARRRLYVNRFCAHFQ